ncbi:MAG: dephospho-CoA kinase [Bdellovibrionaceae bacterium]|nr:dephospho-CoA kinase [Pseudobdellovibrionaceae bacterium]|tara:strand:- start:1638 stop:2267 length:630 start_codon:yes stop_codon:yes gene_type:complete
MNFGKKQKRMKNRIWPENTTVIGLSGNIASGKSTVSKILTRYGFYHIDADQINREIYENNSFFKEQAIKLFQTTDRKIISKIVFNSKEKRFQLEQLVHPLIYKESLKKIKEISQKKGHHFIVYEAALLYETGRYKEMDYFWLVETEEEHQIKRFIKRNQGTKEEATRIIEAQVPITQKRKYADRIFINNGSMEELVQQIETAVKELTQI